MTKDSPAPWWAVILVVTFLMGALKWVHGDLVHRGERMEDRLRDLILFQSGTMPGPPRPAEDSR